jgi:ABC-type transport system involved in cytochrome bd biosynthesis fused ATPase/permease subunit
MIPRRHSQLLFGAILSALMTATVSAFVLVVNSGYHAEFVAQWAKSCATTWPVAFVTVTLLAPLVRRWVERLTG